MTHTAVVEARLAKGDLRVGSIISRAAAVLWRHCLAFSIVALIAYLPSYVTSIAASREMLEWARTTQPSEPAALAQGLNVLGLAALSLVALIVFSTLGEAVIAHAAFQDLRRRPVSMAESSNVVFRRLLPILGFAFVAPFLGIVIGLAAAFGVSSIIVGGSTDLLLMWLGLCLLIIAGLILYTIWFVALPAYVVERIGPWSSLRRSRELTKGHRWKLFGLALLLFIGGFGSSLLQFALAAVDADPIVELIGRLIWQGLWVSFVTTVVAVAYHDLRVAKEGVDIDQIAGVFD